MRYKDFFKITILFLSISLFSQSVDDLYLMSEQFPPYNFEKDGRLQGISIDLMALCLDKLNSHLTREDIRILPWARSYKLLQERESTVLFAMTRTAQRENLFKWVGPISSSKNVLLARKDSQITIDSPEDIHRYRIGAVRDDAGEQLVHDQFGLERGEVELTSKANSSLQQLKSGRIDLFAYDENVARWVMKEEGLDPDEYETVYIMSEGFHYFGFNKETPDELIEQFQRVLDELRKEGTVDLIQKRYQ